MTELKELQDKIDQTLKDVEIKLPAKAKSLREKLACIEEKFESKTNSLDMKIRSFERKSCDIDEEKYNQLKKGKKIHKSYFCCLSE